MRRFRVMVVAQDANPEWVSVPLLGWSHSRAIAELADTHIVTQQRNRAAFLRAGLKEGEDFTAIDSEPAARLAYRLGQLVRGGDNKGWTTMTALMGLSYYYFEHVLWERFGADIRRGRFDLVHRLKPQSPTVPSLLAERCRSAKVPFVLGPLAGGLPWPRQFRDTQHAEKEWLAYLRGASRWLPKYRSTRENASAIIVASKSVFDEMPREYRDKCVYMPENSVNDSRFRPRRDLSFDLPLRIVFVGRLVPYKGADMLIESAAALVRQGKVTIEIIGEGPERPKLQALIEQHGIGRAVTLSGNLPQEELPKRLERAHVFGFPSVREFGGAVVLEVMAMGVVPIVVDYGGPSELVTPESGYKVPLGARHQIVSAFKRLLEDLTCDPSALRGKAECAQQRVQQHFTWRAKAEQTLAVYDWVLGKRPKPSFEAPFAQEPAA